MERTTVNERKIKWRKTGGGSFRMANGRIIKPGQTFNAYAYEIPEGFRDVIIALEKLPGEQDERLDVAAPKYALRYRGGGGWFDVVDGQGKQVNDKALKRAAADKLLSDLEG